MGVRPLAQMRNEVNRRLQPGDMSQEWEEILLVNYFPIFRIACDLVAKLPTQEGSEAIGGLIEESAHLLNAGMARVQDMSDKYSAN